MKTVVQTTMLFELSQHYGLIRVSGKDAQSFLQGQLTVDMREIIPGESRLGAYCNLKGRIRALFRIFQQQDDYLLQLPRSILQDTLTALQKVARFSKVTLKDISEAWKIIGIQGPDPATFIPKDMAALLICAALFESRTQRFEILGPSEILSPIWQNWLSNADNQSIDIQDFQSWKRLDIRAGIPEVWSETVEQLLPHTLSLPSLGAVSFNKGCYCGQEIIARMEYRAQLKRKLFYAQSEIMLPDHEIMPESLQNQIPSPGTKLYGTPHQEQEVGTIISISLPELAKTNTKATIELLIETQETFAQNPKSLFFRLNEQLNPIVAVHALF